MYERRRFEIELTHLELYVPPNSPSRVPRSRGFSPMTRLEIR